MSKCGPQSISLASEPEVCCSSDLLVRSSDEQSESANGPPHRAFDLRYLRQDNVRKDKRLQHGMIALSTLTQTTQNGYTLLHATISVRIKRLKKLQSIPNRVINLNQLQ
jgi:hypothetical protein